MRLENKVAIDVDEATFDQVYDINVKSIPHFSQQLDRLHALRPRVARTLSVAVAPTLPARRP